MRGFGWFSDRELAQIALQTAIPIGNTTTYANFGGFRQRCHSDAALTRVKTSLYPIPVSFFQSQRVIGRHNWRVLVLIGQLNLDQQVHRSPNRV